MAWNPGSSLWSSSASSSFCSSSFFSPGALPESFQHIYFCFNRGQLGSCHSSLNLLTGAGWVSEDAMMTWTVSLTSRNLTASRQRQGGKMICSMNVHNGRGIQQNQSSDTSLMALVNFFHSYGYFLFKAT